MTKFIEITKTNSYGETGKALFNVEDLVGIKQIHVEPEKLYNENGDLVSETPKPNEYTIKLRGVSGALHIDENEYNRLVALLTSES